MTRARNPRRHASYWESGLPARVVAPAEPRDEELRYQDGTGYGHTFSDLCRYARLAVTRTGPMAYSGADRYQEALSAIGEYLCTHPDGVSGNDLIAVGRDSIWAAGRDYRRHHGYSSHVERPEPEASRGFTVYWEHARTVASPENGIVERLALTQVLRTLTPRQRQVVMALAIHDHHGDAADALGMSQKTFNVRLNTARRRYLYWWHEGEQPSGPWGHDRRGGHRLGGIMRRRAVGAVPQKEARLASRVGVPPSRPAAAQRTHCPQGHEYTVENTYVRKNGHRHCRRCVLDSQAARRRVRAERRWAS